MSRKTKQRKVSSSSSSSGASVANSSSSAWSDDRDKYDSRNDLEFDNKNKSDWYVFAF